MAAQPGWYPAGVPGRERWWDGTQWTAYEREAVAPERFAAPQVVQAQGVPESVVQAAVQRPARQQAPQQQFRPATPPMGWYVSPKDGKTRWWNGMNWTGYYLRGGRPRAAAYTLEPPYLGWVLGAMFLFIGLMNLLISRDTLALAIVFSLLGVLWMAAAARETVRRRVPAPQSSPSVDASLRPFPGEAEGPGAGWYPVAANAQRWWTGAQWAHYVLERGSVQPRQFGRQSYRVTMGVGWVFAGLGLVAGVLGIVTIALGGDSDAAIGSIVIAVIFVIVGGVLLLAGRVRRYALILPTSPPPIR